MKIVLLGGNSPTNILWLDNMKIALEEHFDDVMTHHYLHWKNNKDLINLDREINRLKILLKNSHQCVFIAKSAGALLVLKGVREADFSPPVCIFLGLPVLWARENNFEIDSWLKDFSIPTLYIHNSKDPAIHSKKLKSLLKKLNVRNYEITIFPGEKHEYSEFKEITTKIIKFLAKH